MDAFTAAEFGYAGSALQAFEDDADLLILRILLAGIPPDLANGGFDFSFGGHGILLLSRLFPVKCLLIFPHWFISRTLKRHNR
jgi:hypothetical protein